MTDIMTDIMTDNKTILFKLDTCGTDKIIGVGMIGNIGLLFYFMFKCKCNVYLDMYSNGKCIVYDEQYENDFDIKNPFEYYFEPLFTVQDIREEVVLKNRPSIPELKYGHYDLKYKDAYNFLKEMFFRNYKIRDDILSVVMQFEEEHFTNNTILGVQIRTTDLMGTGQNKNIDYFMDKIRTVTKIHDINKIFVATDNNEVITICNSSFSDKTILYLKDIERVNDINNKIGQHDRININDELYSSRKYHNYLCGKEAIIDTLLLSKCDYLIKSFSALSDVALIFNDKIKKVY